MSTIDNIMLLVEQHRTAGGRIEHQATKERLHITIDALVTENEKMQEQIKAVTYLVSQVRSARSQRAKETALDDLFASVGISRRHEK